jgi:hypothetical protein
LNEFQQKLNEFQPKLTEFQPNLNEFQPKLKWISTKNKFNFTCQTGQQADKQQESVLHFKFFVMWKNILFQQTQNETEYN